MTKMINAPVYCTKEQLVATLEQILDGVKSGDTLEGSIEFLLPYEEGPEAADGFMVRASYRIGNLQGQGGLRMLGEMREVPDD